jgi:hypothetical protein
MAVGMQGPDALKYRCLEALALDFGLWALRRMWGEAVARGTSAKGADEAKEEKRYGKSYA